MELPNSSEYTHSNPILVTAKRRSSSIINSVNQSHTGSVSAFKEYMKDRSFSRNNQYPPIKQNSMLYSSSEKKTCIKRSQTKIKSGNRKLYQLLQPSIQIKSGKQFLREYFLKQSLSISGQAQTDVKEYESPVNPVNRSNQHIQENNISSTPIPEMISTSNRIKSNIESERTGLQQKINEKNLKRISELESTIQSLTLLNNKFQEEKEQLVEKITQLENMNKNLLKLCNHSEDKQSSIYDQYNDLIVKKLQKELNESYSVKSELMQKIKQLEYNNQQYDTRIKQLENILDRYRKDSSPPKNAIPNETIYSELISTRENKHKIHFDIDRLYKLYRLMVQIGKLNTFQTVFNSIIDSLPKIFECDLWSLVLIDEDLTKILNTKSIQKN